MAVGFGIVVVPVFVPVFVLVEPVLVLVLLVVLVALVVLIVLVVLVVLVGLVTVVTALLRLGDNDELIDLDGAVCVCVCVCVRRGAHKYVRHGIIKLHSKEKLPWKPDHMSRLTITLYADV